MVLVKPTVVGAPLQPPMVSASRAVQAPDITHLPLHEEKGSLSPGDLVPGHLAFNNSFVDFNIGATWQEEVP